ncbi:SDR family oxidoreductase [Rhabdobacter roseus]|uniref:NAD(P)-dependent dehydrogenase (Short-subunit alcohol dehydrogenase family) n=1 Tax=Rhabdobacter roseus TaxID=1655419 RepID=A0A840U6W3_9BACT|nr:glucose 1-dehydrogenase [Rhabdobacter roseus]MBB5287559.1 NAD(P)-dependent dehydrogenase (short-subunit alcohol dehydrogenase family) [Rhabdobacter roseus]
MKKFQQQVVLITGAASGIGRATALSFAREGGRVVVSDRAEEGGHETVRLIEEAGGEATFLACDVADPAQLQQLVEGTLATYGKLDIAINNAGVGGTFAKTANITPEDYHQTVNINLGGVFFGMQEQLRQMLEQGSGCIVNVASVAGLRGLPNSAVYTATKHAVVGLTKAAAVEYARKNIRINAVCPVFTRSPLFDSLFSIDPSYEEKLKRNIPLGRYGQPEDVAQAILWLCAPDNTFVTGMALPVDGGMMAM